MALPLRFAGCAALIALVGAGACSPMRGHQGYIVDKELVDSIQPGVDNRDSVAQTLGRPTLTSQFGGGDWYYVSRNTKNFGFSDPKVSTQETLRVRFDPAGNVVGVDQMGKDMIANLDPYGKVTPTLGRKRTFFQELFGNIGTVGAGGMGAGAPGAPGQ